MSGALAPIEEVVGPTLDRSVDVRAWIGPKANCLNDFYHARQLIKPNSLGGRPLKMVVFERLDYITRVRIYGHMFDHDPAKKMITLSQNFANRDVYPSDYFLHPQDVLRSVKGALLTCRLLRDEVLTYFLTFYKFHVTFSSFTLGPTFSGLSIKWLNQYAHQVNHLRVEVDFTKLGFAAVENAEKLTRVTSKVEAVLATLVRAIGTRRGSYHMADLHLMVRRYKGMRIPVGAAEDSKPSIPYCPEVAFKVFDCFTELKDLVLDVRMSGFTYGYAREVQDKMWRILPLKEHARGRAWPNYVPPPPTPKFQHISFKSDSSSDVVIQTPGADGIITPARKDRISPAARSSSSSMSTPSINQTGRTRSTLSINTSGQYTPQYLAASPGESSGYGSGNSPGISDKGSPGEPDTSPNGAASDSKKDTGVLPSHLSGHPAFRRARNGSGSTVARPQEVADSKLLSSAFRRVLYNSDPVADSYRDVLTGFLKLPDTINLLNDMDPAFIRAVNGMQLSISPSLQRGAANRVDEDNVKK